MAATDLSFRPLARADFPLVADWLARPHVAQWWDSPQGLDLVEAEYGPCVDGADPTKLFICLQDASPVGLVQIYRMADNPDYAEVVGITDAGGIDLLIGDEATVGRGLGPRIIAAAADLIWVHYPEVGGALAGPSVRNTRSRRAFEKAGFEAVRQVTVPGESDDEMIYFCPRPGASGPRGA